MKPLSEIAKTSPFRIALAVLAVVAGITVGLVAAKYWPGEAPKPVASPPKPAWAAELLKEVGETKQSVEDSQEELNAVRLQMADLYDRLAAENFAAQDRDLRSTLPSPYILQVDNFFHSQAARNLLSPRVQVSTSVRFSAPRFVAYDLLAVPYTDFGKDYYLLVQIKILDYYDLQFDVLWDSMEGQKQ